MLGFAAGIVEVLTDKFIVKTRGLSHKIDIYRDPKTNSDYVLDGRNRLDAMELLGWQLVDDNGKLAVGRKLAQLALRHQGQCLCR
jgi:hypothetical protein